MEKRKNGFKRINVKVLNDLIMKPIIKNITQK